MINVCLAALFEIVILTTNNQPKIIAILLTCLCHQFIWNLNRNVWYLLRHIGICFNVVGVISIN